VAGLAVRADRGPKLAVAKPKASGAADASGTDAKTGQTTARVAGVAGPPGAAAAAQCSKATCGRELSREGAALWVETANNP
jgi:hypothetical protein